MGASVSTAGAASVAAAEVFWDALPDCFNVRDEVRGSFRWLASEVGVARNGAIAVSVTLAGFCDGALEASVSSRLRKERILDSRPRNFAALDVSAEVSLDSEIVADALVS
jgi:hypothetical protein